MSKTFLLLDQISFTYPSGNIPLFESLSLQFNPGWTGIAGANGSGKTTLLRLATGQLVPQSGWIKRPHLSGYCQQRTDDEPAQLRRLLETDDADAHRIRWILGIGTDWPARWHTLSQGERKRCQIGTALWQNPDVLALDEPTNHLDAESRSFIHQSLRAYTGIGLVVSHDRTLLDELCHHCVLIDPPNVFMRSGGISQVLESVEMEYRSQRKEYEIQKKSVKRLDREARRRRMAAENSKERTSKKHLGKKDSDARSKIDLARLTGKDAVGGRLYKRMQGRVDRAREQLEQIQVKPDAAGGINLNSMVSAKQHLYHRDAGSISAGETILHLPVLSIGREDRIGLSGPNGSGKTTLIREIIRTISLSSESMIYIPQEIPRQEAISLISDCGRLPGSVLGHLMTIIKRLGSDPKRLLESTIPSPGETRKLKLALGMTALPQLIVMDEPTNHMDLPSVRCLEEALAATPCALLLVSHDLHFLGKLCNVRWIVNVPEGHEKVKGSPQFRLHIH